MPEWVVDIFGELLFAVLLLALAALTGLLYALLTGRRPLETAKRFANWILENLS